MPLGPVPVPSGWLTCDAVRQLYPPWASSGHNMDSAHVPCQDMMVRDAWL